MKSNSDKEPVNLYKFEYYEAMDDAWYVDWVWLTADEVDSYRSSYDSVKHRKATADEESVYNEAYEDGYGIATVMEITSKHDGVSFRLELDANGELDLNGTKMFQCSICDKHKEFDKEVATSGNFFLTELKNDILWHICFDCAMLQVEVDGINIDLKDES